MALPLSLIVEMRMKISVELCVDSLESLEVAHTAGMHRVELCSALGEGGLSPSLGLMRLCRELYPDLKTHVMIRPRSGDFLYSPAEKRAMLMDVATVRELGLGGIVIGALTEAGDVDEPFIREAVQCAGSALEVTFHRAFDLARDRRQALEQICHLGCHRILTSGGAPTALEGAEEIARLVQQAGHRLSIMPGSGVSPSNALQLLRRTGARELHLSARRPMPSPMRYQHRGVGMGSGSADEYLRHVADGATLAQLMQVLQTCGGAQL